MLIEIRTITIMKTMKVQIMKLKKSNKEVENGRDKHKTGSKSYVTVSLVKTISTQREKQLKVKE